MKRLLMLLVLVVSSVLLNAQTLFLEENFDYGSSNNSDITAVGSWGRHSGAVGPAYTSNGLSYAGYPSSGIGGAISFTNGSSGTNDGDVNRTFGPFTTTGHVYVAFLINLTSAKTTADYFLHLGPSTLGSTFRCRVSAKLSGSGWTIGLAKISEAATFSSATLDFNKTYLVILNYSFSTATVTDDQISLYLYDSGIPATEPGSPLTSIGPVGAGVGTSPNVDLTDVGAIAIRQGSNTPTGFVDGIRISDSWSSVALPVELVSFTAKAAGYNVNLNWNTATEVNNSGFNIERSTDKVNWQNAGFVTGAGNSNSPKEYSYTDKISASGKYYYRLKQIDNDGKYEFSDVVEVNVAGSSLALSQNYPNPCNPEATISYSLAENCHVTLKIYDMMGREVVTLVNEDKPAGQFDVKFNGNSLASGMYVYKLTAGNNTLTRKLSLLK